MEGGVQLIRTLKSALEAVPAHCVQAIGQKTRKAYDGAAFTKTTITLRPAQVGSRIELPDGDKYHEEDGSLAKRGHPLVVESGASMVYQWLPGLNELAKQTRRSVVSMHNGRPVLVRPGESDRKSYERLNAASGR